MTRETSLPPESEILVIEDDARLRRRLAAHLRGLGAEVSEAGTLAEARNLLKAVSFDFAVADVHVPDGETFELLREGAFSENTLVVVMTAFGNLQMAVEAMRLGAGDYLTKPFEPEELPLSFLRCRAARHAARREEVRTRDSSSTADELFFAGALAPLRAKLDTLLAAENRLKEKLPPVLIEGETGTGKSALARWLHQKGPRSTRPMVALNCAALPDSLLESELFGHERGAFTDAKQARVGLFEAADGGTLFLDEVGTLSLAAQAKLLIATEEGRIRRLGGTRELQVNVRLLAATNRPLENLVSQGLFREDLYQRLHLLHLTIPPLRNWGRDIIPLAEHLLARLCAKHRIKVPSISAEGCSRLLAHSWRGNIRELGNELESAIIFHPGETLAFEDLVGTGAQSAPASAPGWRNPSWFLPEENFKLDSVIEELIADALRVCNGNVSAAARRLGVTREFIRYRLQAQQQNPRSSDQGNGTPSR
jgi:DNA-binding NtrC family response regulator